MSTATATIVPTTTTTPTKVATTKTPKTAKAAATTESTTVTTVPTVTPTTNTKASKTTKAVDAPVATTESTTTATTKKTSKKAVKVVDAPVLPTTTATTTVSEDGSVTSDTTPVAASESTATEDVFGPRFASLLDRLSALTTEIRDVSASVRSLQKEHTRFVRDNTKRAKRQRTTKRNASGFAKPTLLSDEMYTFLGIEKGTLVVRNDVTRRINAYVVEHNLRNETDKRRIVPNEQLRTLTNVKDADTLTYFNIQKYIKHHFVKPTVEAVVA